MSYLSRSAWTVLTILLAQDVCMGAPDLQATGVFTRAEVTGPDSTFVTQVLSGTDGLILTQHDRQGIKLAAGFDAHGTWLFDPATGEVRAIGDKWQVFLVGHDLHRLWLAPETRWTRSGRHFLDTSGRQARFSRPRARRPTRLDLRDDEDQPIRVEFSGVDDAGLFGEAVIETDAGDYVYSYTKTEFIARESGLETPPTPAAIELQRLHRLHRMAHLGELPALLAGSPYPLIEVREGVVDELAPADLTTRFTRYFESADFADWYDRAAPVLVISDDQTLASKAVRKTVAIRDADGVREQDFAWLETWHRRDGAWRLVVIASTRAGD